MTASVHLAVGSVFADEFRVLRRLGDGAMGAVYAVEQWRTGHQRALKVMQPALVHDLRLRARFLQEATVGARIKSDHVVHVVDAGIEAETATPWIAMELLEGADLATVLSDGPLPADDAREIFAQLCHALDAAHEAGVVHRDIKPQNVFLATSRREGATFTVKVLDFGIAKLVAEADAARPGLRSRLTSGSVGTPSWMAPEQADPRYGVSPATDVWSLGLLAFALLTGRAFWRAPTPEIPAASARAVELGCAELLPLGFDAWFSRCVAIDPEARFRRVREARAAFDALFVPLAPPPPPTPSRPRTGRAHHGTPPEPAAPQSLRSAALALGPESRRARPAVRHRILVIDDDPADLLIIGHHVSQAGHAVTAASSGREGLAAVAREIPSLIVLDFQLPDMDAPEVLRRLRAEPETHDVPVILLTGTKAVSDIAEGFRAGANDYLSKPDDLPKLGLRIEAALAAREIALRASAVSALEDRHERLVADLEEAAAEQEVTLSMLPAAWDGFWAVGGVAQSGLVGGDLIALYEGAGGARTAVVVDVSGHGAGAALVAASVRATLGLLLKNHGPAEALAALNDELGTAAPRHACVAVVQIARRRVTIVNAGLPPVCVARRGKAIREIACAGVPPGLVPAQTYSAVTMDLEPGDRIAVVSDGLVEPFGLADDALPVLADLGVFDSGRWTGRERPAEVADLLRRRLAEVTQPDDATLLLIQS